MADSYYYPLGYDPIATFTRLHGYPPPGMVKPTQPEPQAATAVEEPPRDGEVAAAPAAGGEVGAEADLPPSPALESPTIPEPAVRQSPAPSELGEDLATPAPELALVTPELKAWLVRNLAALKTLAAAERLPELGEGATLGAPAPPAPPPRPVRPLQVSKGNRWNKLKMTGFLRELAATHCVDAAAKSVGMTRQSAHRLRNRLKGQPFDIAWEAASRHGYDALTDAALDRAINGIEVPHYHNGEMVGTHRKYSDALLATLLKLRNDRGAPQVGRYGAAAEWWSERWDRMLERVETGPVDWSEEHAALGEAELAQLDLPDEDKRATALIRKHAPG